MYENYPTEAALQAQAQRETNSGLIRRPGNGAVSTTITRDRERQALLPSIAAQIDAANDDLRASVARLMSLADRVLGPVQATVGDAGPAEVDVKLMAMGDRLVHTQGTQSSLLAGLRAQVARLEEIA